jgi:hypothetical protein
MRRMNARSSLLLGAGLLVVVVLVGGLVACGGDEPPRPGKETAGGKPALEPVPAAQQPPTDESPWFTEEAQARGITLLNGSGKLRQKELIMEAVGPGAAVIDANADGLLDVYIPNGNWLEGPFRDQFYKGEDRPRSALYIQQQGGTFRDEAKARGVEDDAWAFGACAADLDNDGDEDLVVAALGPNRLFMNDGTGHFRDVAVDAGISGPAERGQWEWSTGIAAGDYDRDGLLDLYIANYADMFKWMREAPEVKRRADGSIENARVCTWQHLLVYCGPKGLPGQQDRLYRGRGGQDGGIRFEDVTKPSGIWRPEEKGGGPLYGFQPLFTDLDNDGWPDIYVANDSVPSFCFLNRRDGTFRECAHELGVALSDTGEDLAGMGAASVDIDGDGWLDLHKTNFAFQTNNVYVSEPVLRDGKLVTLTFRDHSIWNGIKTDVFADLSWGVLVFDFDHDADMDIFYANGHVYPEVDTVPALGTSFDQFNKLFRQIRRGGEIRYERVGREAGPGLEVKKGSRGASLWDFDNDGDLDIIVVNLNNTPDLLVNQRGIRSGHWLQLRLVGNVAKKSNRDAVGSRVRVTSGGRTQHFETKRGEGFLGNHDPRLHVGLGPDAGPVDVEITWPNGEATTHRLEAIDRVVRIEQP